MLIAQITDTHIKQDGRLAYQKVDTARSLARCVEHVNLLNPDLVLVTGDLVDFGRPEEYKLFRQLIAPFSMPVYVIPGNHDERNAMREAFKDHHYLPESGEFLHYVIDDYPVRLIGLDTSVPGQAGGELCPRRLEWLDKRLSESPKKPTVIFMHHPPFLTGIKHMDVQNCSGGTALGVIIDKNPQVLRLLCGHVHRAIQVRFHGTVASIGPSHSHATALDLRAESPPAFVLDPPACQLHLWRKETGLVSHLSFIGNFDGPFPFFDAQGRLID